MASLCAIYLLVVKMAPSVFPQREIVPAPGLFGHSSSRVAQAGACEPPQCPSCKSSLCDLWTACSDSMPSRCIFSKITHGSQGAGEELQQLCRSRLPRRPHDTRDTRRKVTPPCCCCSWKEHVNLP